jgi:hypothetical protein
MTLVLLEDQFLHPLSIMQHMYIPLFLTYIYLTKNIYNFAKFSVGFTRFLDPKPLLPMDNYSNHLFEYKKEPRGREERIM